MKQKNDEILLETGTNEVEIAEFSIRRKGSEKGANQSFGINVAKVREIMKLPKITTMPSVDGNLLGIFKLRDQIIPLVDLAAWMHEETDVDYKKCYVIVTEFNQTNFGFVIHGINRIHRISWEKLLSPENLSSATNTTKIDCITGLVNFEDHLMMMLDFERIVSDINPELGLSVQADREIINDIQNLGTENPKILLAEDSTTIRDLIAEILEKGGFEVVHVQNGKVALEYLQAFAEEAQKEGVKIDDYLQAVVTDIEMPQMDGHTLCKQIKQNPALKELPVILFSSLIYDEIRRKGELIGADAQISKPEIGKLITIIRDLLKKKGKT